MNTSTQRGFLSLGLTGYLALGAGAVILALGIAVKVQSARLDAAQQKNEALAQQVSQWTAAAKACSDSVEKAKNEADRRTRNAAIALKQAQATVGATEAEIARLRSSKPVSAECPAGQAVGKVREGLATNSPITRPLQ